MTRQLALVSTGYQESLCLEVQAHVDREVTALIGDLLRIGRRLQSRPALDHPRLRAALGQFDTELAAALGQSRGRHRLVGAGGEGTQAAKPLEINSGAEFVRALRQYRAARGNTSFRQMAARARYVVPHSAMCVALNSEELPSLEVVLAIVAGCGGSLDDQECFVAAWRRLQKDDPESSQGW